MLVIEISNGGKKQRNNSSHNHLHVLGVLDSISQQQQQQEQETPRRRDRPNGGRRHLDPRRGGGGGGRRHRGARRPAQVRRRHRRLRRSPRHGGPHGRRVQVRGLAAGVLLHGVAGDEGRRGEEARARCRVQGGRAAQLVHTILIGRKQVLSNSGIASVLVVLISLITQGKDRCLDSKESSLVTGLIGGVIGHYACCNGDTWSSELGILSKSQPRLITTFKRVQRGTNGGVTIDGLIAASAAGFVIGLAFVLIGFLTTQCAADVFWRQLLVIPIATAAGLCGSLMDSFLGATVQYSGYCSVRKKVVGVEGPTVTRISGINVLDNNGVNVVSVLLTTLLTGLACIHIF